MAQGLLTKDTELHYDNNGTFERIDYLMEVPELGGEPEQVETTTLQDGTRRYIPGIKDPGDLEFNFLYDNETEGSNFRIAQGLAEAGNPVDFKVVFPDGTEWAFTGIPNVRINAAGVNEALTFTLSIMLQSEFEITHPA